MAWFPHSLARANPKQVLKWRIISGVTAGGTGIAEVADRLNKLAPGVDEHFLRMAVVFAFVAALPLLFFPLVITVSLAELGVATAVVFLGYSIIPVFAGLDVVPRVLIIIVAVVLLLAFSKGVRAMYRLESKSDVALAAVLLLLFFAVWIYPLIGLGRIQ